MMTVAVKKPKSTTKKSATKPKKKASSAAGVPSRGSPVGNEHLPPVAELVALQRERVVVMKMRIMQTNYIVSQVAGSLGYSSGLTKAQRDKMFDEARELIDRIRDGEDHEKAAVVRLAYLGIDGANKMEAELKSSMTAIAESLPVAAWVEEPEQRGFSVDSLARVVGESGDLSNYSGPKKLWRRFGCEPRTFNGKTMMGSAWRWGKLGKLPKEEWEKFGYSPRRRSIAYMLSVGLVNQNQTGPYRTYYDKIKLEAAVQHPDWTKRHVDMHARLLVTKMLLKRLWCAWNGKEVID